MQRIYIPRNDFSNTPIELTDKKEIHHCLNVLRLKEGTKVEVFNGAGLEAAGKIVSASKHSLKIGILNKKEKIPGTPRIILACAIPKRSKFETIIEKATELGISDIIPLETKRTDVKIKQDQMTRKLKRFESVAINACKQSKRANVPTIAPVMTFPVALHYLISISATFIPSLTDNTKPLIETLSFLNPKTKNCISFMIGPEGDFTPQEYKEAFDAGATPVSLGPTTLKVETAALCVCSVANLLFN